MVKPIPDGAMFLRASAGYIHSLLAQGFVDNQLSTLPQGHNQPVVVATGLLGPKASVNQLIRFLQKTRLRSKKDKCRNSPAIKKRRADVWQSLCTRNSRTTY